MATGMTDINNSMALTLTKAIAKEPTLNMKLKPHPPSREQPSMAAIMSKAPPHIRFQNLRLDPARALEPARKKLTTIEAQRVMSVFEETLRRVEVVTLLPHLMQNLERFRVSLGTELVGLLKHHAVIISSYDEIRQELDKQLELRAALQKAKEEEDARLAAEAEAARAALAEMEGEGTDEGAQVQVGEDEEPREVESAASDRSGNSTDSLLEATMRNLSLVAQQMSHSTRNILRAFNANPAIIVMIQGELAHRNAECQSLLDYLQELKEILMHKLLTTPEEEGERMAYITEIAKRERQNAVVIDKLETELKEKIDDKNDEIRKKNDIIKRLQSDLHQIEKFSEEHIRRVRADAEKQEAADEKNSDGKRQKLQAEVAQLRSQLQNATIEHREREQDLRSKKFKIETEVENWIQRYDQELGERQDEYEEIDAVYTEEKKQLHELEERFNTLEKEYNSILEERRLAREKREKAERVMAMMVKAATTIQAYWRSYKVRKALQARKKKKGGGGGKGKGKK